MLKIIRLFKKPALKVFGTNNNMVIRVDGKVNKKVKNSSKFKKSKN